MLGCGIEILYKDPYICVCKKIAGIPCESKKASQMDVVKLLKRQIFLEEVNKGEPYLSLVHRLDQPVGGVLLLARNRQAAAELSRQLTQHLFVKQYLAVVMKKTQRMISSGHLEDDLIRDGKINTSRVASANEVGAKKAILDYEILKTGVYQDREVALAKITLQTGRHHQIRVQMAAHGMPLMFDRKYNSMDIWKCSEEDIALYAFHLEFYHPESGKKMSFTDAPKRDIFHL